MALLRLSRRPVFVPALGLGVEHFPCYVNRRRNRNAHDLVELTLIVAGEAVCHLDDLGFAVGPGSLTAVGFGEAHCLVTGAAGVEVWNLYLDPRRLALPELDGGLATALAAFLPLHPALAHRGARLAHLRFPDPAPLVAVLRELAAELAAREPGWQSAAGLAGQRLLLLCARRARATGVPALRADLRPADARLGPVLACIDADPTAPHALPDLAGLAGLSPAQVVRRCRAATGLAPMQYVRRRRLERACGLLAGSAEPVAAVARTCGFPDLGNFHRAFRRVLGCTPAAWRRRMTAG